jgi:hypothetical protein
MEVLSEHAIL